MSTNKAHPNLELIAVTPELVPAWAATQSPSFILPSEYDKEHKSFTWAIFPNGFTEEVTAHRIKGYHEALSTPNMHFFLIRDVTSQEYVGVSRWLIHPHPEPFDEAAEIAQSENEYLTAENVPGINRAALRMLRIAQAKAKAKYLGDRAFVYLWILGTIEAAQGKGVGVFGLQWGMDKARELDIPVYLDSGENAVGFYEKQGFKQLGMLDYDARQVGFHSRAGFVAMIWEPSWEKGTGS